MALFQWQQIDPAPEEIDRALVEAGQAAGGRRPTAGERQDALAQGQGSAAGALTWGKASRVDRPFRRVTCVWWTDHLGRKHWFVEGDEYRTVGEPNPLWRCLDYPPAHPLCVIDPLHTVFRGQGVGAELLVVCACGEVGPPAALGWTGDRCGPCADRLAEGAAPQAPEVVFHPHRTGVAALTFTEDERVVSVGYRDGAVHLHDPRTGQGAFLAAPSNLGGAGAAAVPGGVAVAFTRAEVVCWDLPAGTERWRVRCPGELMGLAVSPEGEWLAVDAVSRPYLLDADTGEGEGLSEDLSYFAFAADGTLHAYNSDTRAVATVDLDTGDPTDTGLEFGEPEEDDCYALACSPTRSLLAAGCTGGWVRVGDPATGTWLHALRRPASIVNSLAFAPDGVTLASGHERTVMFWDAETGNELGELTLPLTGVSALAFAADGQVLAVGDEQGVVRLWAWRRLCGQ